MPREKRIGALVEASSVRPVGEKWGWIGQHRRRPALSVGQPQAREATSGKEGAPIDGFPSWSSQQIRFGPPNVVVEADIVLLLPTLTNEGVKLF